MANTNLGLDLHSNTPNPVNFVGHSPRLGGHNFLLGGHKQSLGGHGPGMPPHGAGSVWAPPVKNPGYAYGYDAKLAS